jgi:DNA-binding IclR family transcriptional regulator
MKQEIKFKRIQCLDRALDVITLLSETHGLSMNEIAQKMNLKVGTVYNIVQTLTSRGFLSNVNRRFEIGPSLGLAASRWDIEGALPHLVAPILSEINEKTGDLSCVTIPVNGHQAEIITPQKNSSDVSMRFTHTTWRYPLYIATGRILVAFGSNEVWDEIINEQLASGPVASAEKGWTHADWYEHLLKIREDGYVIITPRRPSEGGVSGVAVPFFNPAGNLLASIGASTRKSSSQLDQHLHSMKESVAAAISNNPLWGMSEVRDD